MPTFDSDILPALTRERVATLRGESAIRAGLIPQDGSDRAYYRLTHGDGRPTGLVVMHFGTERAENLSFAPITVFLHSIGAACPRLQAVDEERRLLWLEDLGDRDLACLGSEPWASVRRPLYEDALAEVARLHSLTPERLARLDGAPLGALQPPFDADLYRWEQDYFFENFASRFSAASPGAVASARAHPCFEELSSGLAALPRALIHRDFQSRNILIRDGRAVLIDYQGMRFGRPEYDVASLLYDPYVSIEEADRAQLFESHRAHLAPLDGAPALSRDIFLKCAAQRLMQALGAYGFLGVVKQKRRFLASIPPAVQNLRAVIGQLPSLEALRPILELRLS